MAVDGFNRLGQGWAHDHDKTRPYRTQMSVAGAEDAQSAESAEAWRQTRSALHRSAVGDRHPQPDPGNWRQGRVRRRRGTANRIPDRKGQRTAGKSKRLAVGYGWILRAKRSILPATTKSGGPVSLPLAY